jgi:hypothetical protein
MWTTSRKLSIPWGRKAALVCGLVVGHLDIGHHALSSSGGSPHLSAICWQMLAISVRTSNTTRSMLRRIARSPRGRTPRRQARQCGQCDTGNAVDQFVYILPAHQLPLLLGDAEPEQFGLRPLKISVRLTAWRLLFLASQEPQICNAALIEREAVTLPLDRAFDFADVTAAAIEVQRKCRARDDP